VRDSLARASYGRYRQPMASQVATAGREQPGARHLNGAARRENEHVLIVGAGFAGLGMAIRLKQAGIDDFTVLEQSWYLTRSGKNTISWPGFTFEYRLKLRRFDAANYQLAPRSEPAHAAAE
jgi:cation diffusion facilitator CzcD-associated flavoprotein CzcO